MKVLRIIGALFVFAVPLLGSPRPNFVIVFADDLGYGDLGSYGNLQIRTPHLDRMAREGIKLTSFYAAPTCTPARAMLMTGRYPIRSGLIRPLHPGEDFGMPASEVTLAEAVGDLGYTTALIGKWHLGSKKPYRPVYHGFDYYFGLLHSHDMTLLSPDLARLRLYRDDKPIAGPVTLATLTRRYTQEAIEFIEHNKDRPFLLYLAHSMPHVPPRASEAFKGKSARGIYGDSVEEMDWGMGELFAALRRIGLDENTLVIFVSDNGPALGKGAQGGSAVPLRGGKHSTWEGGVRVPFIARWPGRISAGAAHDGIASLMDIYTTTIELAGGRVPSDRPVDGRNIMTMLQANGPSPHSTFIFYKMARLMAIRSGEWKLHFFRVKQRALPMDNVVKCDPPELYNLSGDIAEKSNVTRDHSDIVAKLTQEAEDFLETVVPGKLPPRRWLLR
jgi:arylsulfatase A-like enzyme